MVPVVRGAAALSCRRRAGGPSSRRFGPEGLGTGTKNRMGACAARSSLATGAARVFVAYRIRREAGAKAGF